jgi:hypothetical protein
VRQSGHETPKLRQGIVEEPQLTHHTGAVVVDSLARQALALVKCVNGAEWKPEASSGGWHTPPLAELRTRDYDFEDDRTCGNVAVGDLDMEIGHRGHERLVIGAHSLEAATMILPGFVIVGRLLTEGSHDSGEIVCVFETHVLFDQTQPRVAMIIIGTRHRNVLHQKYRSIIETAKTVSG